MLLGCSRSPQAEERYWQKEFARQDEARAKIGWPPLTEEERSWRYRLRHLRGGGQLMVDGFGQKDGVNIFDEKGRLFYKRASVNPRNQSKWGYGHELGVPLTLRAEWRVDGPEVNGVIQNRMYADMTQRDERYAGGIVIGNYTVAVAERLPQALLDDIPKYDMFGFHLKIRLHDEGVLIGWHLGNMVDRIHVGGDFEEMHVVYEGDNRNLTRRWAKGWYIHPRTKERIETDF